MNFSNISRATCQFCKSLLGHICHAVDRARERVNGESSSLLFAISMKIVSLFSHVRLEFRSRDTVGQTISRYLSPPPVT